MQNTQTLPPPPRLWPWWSTAAREEVHQLLESGDLAGAAATHLQIDACEQLASQTLAPGRPMLLCDSGTSALETAYQALRLEEGAHVLVASHSFRSTVTAMLPAGLIPVLCDADPTTGGIDLQDAASRVTGRTAALVITHTWGRPVPLQAARAFVDRHGLALIEDCSHAHGTRWRDQLVGTVGDVAIWSCGTWKTVSGGKAGLLSAADPAVWERARVLAQPKRRALNGLADLRLRALSVTGVGHNRRPHPVAAVLAADHLRRLPDIVAVKTERERAVDALMVAVLPDLAALPDPSDRTAGTLYKMHWRARSADAATVLVEVLRAFGIRAALPARPLHELPLFTDPDLGALLGLPAAFHHDPDGFGGTCRLLDALVEVDTRDLYEPLFGPDPYEAALTRAAELIARRRDR